MKKITLFAAVVIAVSFTSCKKNYSCVCTINSGGISGSQTYHLGKVKKSYAKSYCQLEANDWIAAGGNCETRIN